MYSRKLGILVALALLLGLGGSSPDLGQIVGAALPI